MYDYKSIAIYKDGFRVRRLTIVGIVVEHFLALAFHDRRGLNNLAWQDVEGSVTLYNSIVNDRNRQEIQVSVPEEDAKLALKIAKGIADVLIEHEFFILDAIVPQSNKAGQHVGDHDLIGERRCVSTGRSSIEVKCRQILSDSFRDKVRQQLRGQAFKVWDAAMEANNAYTWGERVVALVEYGPGALDAWKAIRVEAWSRQFSKWGAICGWSGRPATMANISAPVRVERALSSRSQQQQRPVATKRPFDQIMGESALEWETIDGKTMVLDLVETPAAKRAKPTIGEKLPRWQRRFQWPGGSFTKSNHKGSKGGGGKKMYMVTRHALADIYKIM